MKRMVCKRRKRDSEFWKYALAAGGGLACSSSGSVITTLTCVGVGAYVGKNLDESLAKRKKKMMY